MIPTVIVANDLGELWFESIRACFNSIQAKTYKIDKGSFEGHTRYQLFSFTGIIEYPNTRPLAPILPEGQTGVTDDDYICKYFAEYIMNPDKAPNEEYSYGEFIYPHLDNIVDMLKRTPQTNHAVINIGEPFYYELGYAEIEHHYGDEWVNTKSAELWNYPKYYENPPCLRCITWQVNNDDTVTIAVFFRSWDIYAGMPTNLGGMQLLNEYICNEIGRETGPMIVYSSGAHVYDTAIPMVEARLGKSLSV